VKPSDLSLFAQIPETDPARLTSKIGPCRTLARGFVLGGGLVGQDISDPEITYKSGTESETLSVGGALGVGAMGPFIDWFPHEDKGLHFGTMIGFGILGLKHGYSGIGGSLWGGYDFWVASQWSLGIEARVAALRSTHSESSYYGGTVDIKDSAIRAELLFTALYN
jgi:hypothetical protein